MPPHRFVDAKKYIKASIMKIGQNLKKSLLSLALIKYCPQTYPVIGKINQLNSGKAVNPPADPIKSAKNKFMMGMPKSVPLNNVPIIDIMTAMTIQVLFESSSFFNIPIEINAKPANAKISTQKSNSPPDIGKASQFPKRIPETRLGIKNSKIFTNIPKMYNIAPLFTILSH